MKKTKNKKARDEDTGGRKEEKKKNKKPRGKNTTNDAELKGRLTRNSKGKRGTITGKPGSDKSIPESKGNSVRIDKSVESEVTDSTEKEEKTADGALPETITESMDTSVESEVPKSVVDAITDAVIPADTSESESVKRLGFQDTGKFPGGPGKFVTIATIHDSSKHIDGADKLFQADATEVVGNFHFPIASTQSSTGKTGTTAISKSGSEESIGESTGKNVRIDESVKSEVADSTEREEKTTDGTLPEAISESMNTLVELEKPKTVVDVVTDVDIQADTAQPENLKSLAFQGTAKFPGDSEKFVTTGKVHDSGKHIAEAGKLLQDDQTEVIENFHYPVGSYDLNLPSESSKEYGSVANSGNNANTSKSVLSDPKESESERNDMADRGNGQTVEIEAHRISENKVECPKETGQEAATEEGESSPKEEPLKANNANLELNDVQTSEHDVQIKDKSRLLSHTEGKQSIELENTPKTKSMSSTDCLGSEQDRIMTGSSTEESKLQRSIDLPSVSDPERKSEGKSVSVAIALGAKKETEQIPMINDVGENLTDDELNRIMDTVESEGNNKFLEGSVKRKQKQVNQVIENSEESADSDDGDIQKRIANIIKGIDTDSRGISPEIVGPESNKSNEQFILTNMNAIGKKIYTVVEYKPNKDTDGHCDSENDAEMEKESSSDEKEQKEQEQAKGAKDESQLNKNKQVKEEKSNKGTGETEDEIQLENENHPKDGEHSDENEHCKEEKSNRGEEGTGDDIESKAENTPNDGEHSHQNETRKEENKHKECTGEDSKSRAVNTSMDDEVAKAERMVKNATKDSDTENDEVLEKFYKRHKKEK